MKFLKGAMIGGMVATGIFMMYSDNEANARKKIMRKGKKMMKKIGVM